MDIPEECFVGLLTDMVTQETITADYADQLRRDPDALDRFREMFKTAVLNAITFVDPELGVLSAIPMQDEDIDYESLAIDVLQMTPEIFIETLIRNTHKIASSRNAGTFTVRADYIFLE